MSKICLHCGYTNDDQAHFCVRCGARFSENAENGANPNVRFGENGLPSREAGQEQQPSAITGDGAAALDEKKTETELKDRDAGEFSRSFPSDAPSGGGEASDENKISAEWQGTNCRCAFGTNPSAPASGAENAPYNAPVTTANGTPYRPVAGNRYPPYAPAPNAVYSPQYYAAQRQRYEEAAKIARVANTKKTLFILSFVGLLLDFLCGIGALMCLPAAIISSVYSVRLYREEKKTSTQLVWAMIVGYVGAVLGILFLVLMIR